MDQAPPKLLIVDDNDKNLHAIRRVLEDLNIELVMANSGEEALKLALHHEFFLILMDVHMPHMDGLETVSILRRDRGLETPIIFVTAVNTERRFVFQGYGQGAFDYLLKPIDPVVLHSKVNMFLELYQKHREIEIKNQDLRAFDKLRSRFLAYTTHELKSPLNSILTYARNFVKNPQGHLDEEEVIAAKIVCSEAEDLLYLINDILDLSKIEAGKLDVVNEKVGLVSILEELHIQFFPLTEKQGISFTVSSKADTPGYIHTDPHRIKQILRNFIGNALKFTEQGGSINVSVGQAPGPIQTINRKIKSPCAVFEVKDTGIGIPEDRQQAIFKAFEQANRTTGRKYGGTGLGLNIALMLSDILNGGIQLKSKIDEGSTFSLYLPLISEES